MNNTSLIINADDYGYNAAVNTAIVNCFKMNIINSTTIMTNMEGFEDAVSLAFQNGFKNSIGLHINLTEGTPLTDMSGTKLVDKDGNFIMGVISKPFILLPSLTRTKIKNEIREQYNKLTSSGICPTHIDSHQHVHTLPLLVPIFLDLAKDKNQKLRIASVKKRKNFIKIMYTIWLNSHLRERGVNFSDIFGNVNYLGRYLTKNHSLGRVFEIMVHPGYNEHKLIDIFEKTDIEEKINWLKQLYQKKLQRQTN